MGPARGTARPPSVDALARTLAPLGVPHVIAVECARAAIDAGDPSSATARAIAFRRSLLGRVINATGVLLHTNLGRAPIEVRTDARPSALELDLASGGRGSRQAAVGPLLARLCGAEAAMVVNNNAAAVMLVLAALAFGRGVAVSRGESVEIGGAFRIPDVMEQSGATLVDVGTTNRTRLGDYAAAIARPEAQIALTMKVHPSNFRIEGFVRHVSVAELATLSVPVIADIGSGLIDATCPWVAGPPPGWLADEPAARQTLDQGAALVTFSADKLFGSAQAGIIAGRRDLVARCAAHPLARALRPGSLVLGAVQATALSYLDRSAATTIPFWKMATASLVGLEARAQHICAQAGVGVPAPTLSTAGGGAAPGSTIDSFGVVLAGDRLRQLRAFDVPIIARVREGSTILDLRSVDAADDSSLVAALATLGAGEVS